jgi:hypothetical protein
LIKQFTEITIYNQFVSSSVHQFVVIVIVIEKKSTVH